MKIIPKYITAWAQACAVCWRHTVVLRLSVAYKWGKLAIGHNEVTCHLRNSMQSGQVHVYSTQKYGNILAFASLCLVNTCKGVLC